MASGDFLRGKVALVTGASSGIGEAIAKALASHGAHVALAARRTTELEKVRSEIMEGSPSAKVILGKVDVTVVEQVRGFAEETVRELGAIDILVNNAGVMVYQLIKNADVATWDTMIDVNCKGMLHTIAAVLPDMIQRKSGHIINITSDAGRKVFPGLGVYSGTKMFMEAVSQAIRLENIGSGLRVTCIQPGNVATNLVNHSNKAAAKGDEEAMKRYGEPSGYQVLEPSNVADAVLFALSQPSHVATNEILVEPRDEPI